MRPIRFAAGDRILAVVAHPDDEILGCYGLLAKARHATGDVRICIANDGKQSRLPVSQNQAALLGIEVFTDEEILEAREVVCDRALVRVMDKWIKDFEPTLIVTHGQFDGDHQEHRAVGQAVAICWQRFVQSTGRQCRLLRMCPIPTGIGFTPNAMCGIDDVLDSKTRALDAMMAVEPRWYLSSSLASDFAAALARRHAEGTHSKFVEAFDEECARAAFDASP